MNIRPSTALIAGALVLVVPASARGPVQRVKLVDSVLSVLSRSRVTGVPSPSQTLYLTLGLQPRHPAEFQAFCDAVSNPSSPNYRQWMTPEQVGEAFGASATDVQASVAYLKSQGLKIDFVSRDRIAISAHGSVAQVEAAFGTKIKTFQGPDPAGISISFRANQTPVQIPTRLAGVIQCVGGIESYMRPQRRTTLTPTLARGLYNTAPSYAGGTRGQGRKIGYSNWDDVRLADANLYYTTYGLPTPAGGLGSNFHVVVVGSGHNMTTAGAEGNLDLQMESAAAPLADIYIYDNVAGDLLGVLAREASDNLCEVLSESWGWQLPNSSYANACHNQHLAMTAHGQTYLCASGDSGTADPNSYPYPGVDPDVTNVGGTIATVNGSGIRTAEVSWNGSGGGWCTNQSIYPFNTHPTWQVGNNVPTGNNHRLIPDIGMHSASSGDAFFIIYNGGVGSVSGTSCASPYCASSLATLQQRLVALNLPGRLGRINDMIYAQNGRSDVWFDVVAGSSNGTLPDNTASVPRAGWDFVTGWGAPNFDGWYTALSIRNISGQVTLQNYSPGPNGVQVTVQLYQAGTSTLVDTKVATLDGAGNVTVTSQAPGGNYDVYVKASHWLRRKVANQSFGLSGLSGLSWSLLNGDVNGDNAVTVADFVALRAAFGSSVGDPNYNPNADLNGDGAITISDFTILRSNFGQSGD